MKIIVKREKRLYGNKVEEEYKFSFSSVSGTLNEATLKVKSDRDGEGFPTNTMIGRRKEPLDDIPQDVREEVAQRLANAREEVVNGLE